MTCKSVPAMKEDSWSHVVVVLDDHALLSVYQNGQLIQRCNTCGGVYIDVHRANEGLGCTIFDY